MESQKLVNYCMSKGFLVDKEVYQNCDFETAKNVVDKLIGTAANRIITKDVFEEVYHDLKKSNLVQQRCEVLNTAGNKDDVRIVSDISCRGKKLEVKDFVKYFRARLYKMGKILQEHAELDNLVSINKISGDKKSVSIIGIVLSRRVTKNKNILFEVEDLTGKIKVLVNQNNSDLYKMAEDAALDSVLGFNGECSRDFIFASDIVFPGASLQSRKSSVADESALFIGDLHIGSSFFMEESFLKFVDYLNGNVPDTPEVEKIKYLFVTGDIIAGVGIYSGQENDLSIGSVEEQYRKAAELFGKIRKDIKIIISPGNCDAVRVMEPQPMLDEKFALSLCDLKNVILMTNPCRVNIGAKKDFEGFDVLSYHGFSYNYYGNNIPKLVKEKAIQSPEKIMQYLLKHRHLAPTYSSTLYFPSEDDSFIINSVPDIFISGHTRRSAAAHYNNILVISSSSWENSPFLEKTGSQPDFCKVPMFNLKTRAVKILDFE